MLAARRRLAEKRLPREWDVLLVEQTTQTANAPARPRKAGLTGESEGSNQSVAPRLRRYLAHPLVGRTRRGQGEARGVTVGPRPSGAVDGRYDYPAPGDQDRDLPPGRPALPVDRLLGYRGVHPQADAPAPRSITPS